MMEERQILKMFFLLNVRTKQRSCAHKWVEEKSFNEEDSNICNDLNYFKIFIITRKYIYTLILIVKSMKL